MRRATVIWPLVEVLAMSALLTSYIWVWGNTFEGFQLCVILYAVIGLASHLRAGELPTEIGVRVDNLGSAALAALVATAAIGLFLVGAGALFGSLDLPALTRWPVTLPKGIGWGLVQQYGLLCFYYRRFRELLPRHPSGPLWASSAVFALLHLPNPFMTLATFAAGALSCWLYRRTPNVFVLGVMHGVISFLIVETLPLTLTMGMRVGPGYFRFVPGQ